MRPSIIMRMAVASSYLSNFDYEHKSDAHIFNRFWDKSKIECVRKGASQEIHCSFFFNKMELTEPQKEVFAAAEKERTKDTKNLQEYDNLLHTYPAKPVVEAVSAYIEYYFMSSHTFVHCSRENLLGKTAHEPETYIHTYTCIHTCMHTYIHTCTTAPSVEP